MTQTGRRNAGSPTRRGSELRRWHGCRCADRPVMGGPAKRLLDDVTSDAAPV